MQISVTIFCGYVPGEHACRIVFYVSNEACEQTTAEILGNMKKCHKPCTK